MPDHDPHTDGNAITRPAGVEGDWRKARDRARTRAIEAMHETSKRIADAEVELDRYLVELRDEHEMTFAAIAEATGMTVSIVRARYERAKGG